MALIYTPLVRHAPYLLEVHSKLGGDEWSVVEGTISRLLVGGDEWSVVEGTISRLLVGGDEWSVVEGTISRLLVGGDEWSVVEGTISRLLVGGDEWSVVEGTISVVAMVHLLSPAADVSNSFTSLEEHCRENSTWRRNEGYFDCLEGKEWVLQELNNYVSGLVPE